VFAFHPHRDHAVADLRDCRLLPDTIPEERALFLPFVETALNLALDATPLTGERALVCGQGVIGLLVTAVLSRFPLAELIASDPIAMRRDHATRLGASLAVDPGDPVDWENLHARLFAEEGDGLDFAVEVSGRLCALNQTLELCGFGARVILGSWYGHDRGTLDLGGHFHRRRIRLSSSQVSTLNPKWTGRWSKSRLWRLAEDWLERIQPERLITHRLPLDQCTTAFDLAHDAGSGALQIVFDCRSS
jgi:threonine dehydrogenase-like Zn-dependent dehydrogenase